MTSTYTNNLNLELQAAGENVDLWGDPHLNQNVFTPIDGAMGGVLPVPLTNSDVTLTNTQFCSQTFALSGILSGNVSVLLPLSPNSVGSATAVGGTRIFDNQCTGNFTVTVKTAATGSTGVVVAQGVKSVVTSDQINVSFSDSRLGTSDVLRIPSCSGSPNGSVTAVAGTEFKPASMVFDRTNGILYAATADGASGWVPQSGYFPNPQGYLTPTSGTPVISGDVVAATTVYYTPYVGNVIPIYNGSWMQPYFFTEAALTLTSSQAASQIYDVFAALNSGSVVIGTGPAWSAATPGSSARGTGAGSTQLSRVNGLLVNTVAITLRNGAASYSIGVNQATYLGSIYIDSTNGQVSCYRSFGQSRKWGVWNAYNRVPIILQVGDATASWSYSGTTVRVSNNNTANSCVGFAGLAEETIDATFVQTTNSRSATPCTNGIGVNSTSSMSGLVGGLPSDITVIGSTGTARSVVQPTLGLTTITCLETGNGVPAIIYGSASHMLLTAAYRG